jgi:hypothetical protein
MDSENKSLVTLIKPETHDTRVTINYRPRNVTMYYVSDQELEIIGSSNAQSSLHLTFFGVFAGAALALGLTLITLEIADPRIYAAFWAGLTVSLAFTIYFGIRSFVDWKNSAKQIKAIRAESANREPADGIQ